MISSEKICAFSYLLCDLLRLARCLQLCDLGLALRKLAGVLGCLDAVLELSVLLQKPSF